MAMSSGPMGQMVGNSKGGKKPKGKKPAIEIVIGVGKPKKGGKASGKGKKK